MSQPPSASRRPLAALTGFALCLLAAMMTTPTNARAEDAGARPHPAEPGERPALPAAVSTPQTITLAGRTLHVTATAGAIPLRSANGTRLGELAYTAYRLDGADPATRPVTFAINGGPGFASAWLQLGALGPWRLAMTGAAVAPSAAPTLLPNDETWLDFTDLVFIDPAGTGYARVDSDEARKTVWSVTGDIDGIADAIAEWLARNGRLLSPKYIAGESYGGFRAPRLVRRLAQRQGVGIAGIVLISPALDMAGGSRAFDPLEWVGLLPSEVAVTRAAHGPQTRAALADAESYAAGAYLTDLVHGLADADAVARIDAKVTALTGLDAALVKRYAGRLDASVFTHEVARAQGMIASVYDATVTKPDPFPAAAYARPPDAMVEALEPPFASAMVTLYEDRLHWRPSTPYRLFNREAAFGWDWGKGERPQAVTALREALALDPGFHVVVAAGLYDLVVPYFRTQMLLDTIPRAAGGDRVRYVVEPGGHMVYSTDEGRMALRDAARTLIAP